MQPTVTVTGANGHIGSHIVRVLLESGTSVRAVVRKTSDLRSLQTEDGQLLKGVSLAYADMLDKDALWGALAGTKTLYHTAALFKTRKVAPEQITSTNVQGTRHVLEVCRELGTLDRLVYTSSVAAIGFSRSADRVLDEESFNDQPIDTYVASKVGAEQLALNEYSRTGLLPLIFVNPATVLGDLDYSMTPSNAFVALAIRRPPPFYYDGGHSYVSARSVAEAHVNAASRGRLGERYILSGDNLDMREFFAQLSAQVKTRKPFFKLGAPSIGLLATGFEVLGKIANRSPLITRKKALQLCSYYGFYRCDKAKAELDYRPVGFQEILDSAVTWYRRMNWI